MEAMFHYHSMLTFLCLIIREGITNQAIIQFRMNGSSVFYVCPTLSSSSSSSSSLSSSSSPSSSSPPSSSPSSSSSSKLLSSSSSSSSISPAPLIIQWNAEDFELIHEMYGRLSIQRPPNPDDDVINVQVINNKNNNNNNHVSSPSPRKLGRDLHTCVKLAQKGQRSNSNSGQGRLKRALYSFNNNDHDGDDEEDGEEEEEEEEEDDDDDDNTGKREEILTKDELLRIPEGSDAILPCSTSGRNKPEVTWYFNYKPLDLAPRHQRTSDGLLKIYRASWADGGIYECRHGGKTGMSGQIGMGQNRKKPIASILLEVLAPPKFLTTPVITDKIIVGQELNLHCEAYGSPEIHYEWLKEQKTSNKIRMKTKLSENKKTYSLTKTTIEDEGRYYCRVTNQYGNNESYVDVKFLVPPKITELTPKISTREGGPASITCATQGVPLPRIIWMVSTYEGVSYDGVDELKGQGFSIEDGNDGFNSSTERRSVLKLKNAKRNLAGNVTCLAYNEIDKCSKMSPFYVEYKPKTEIVHNVTYGWVGQIKVMKCRGVGYPKPSLTWFRDYLTLVESEEDGIFKIENEIESYNSENSYLTISINDELLWIYGNYSCLAKNIHGHSSAYALLIRAQLPEQPRNVTIIEETSTSVKFTASLPITNHGLQITNWSVSYEEQLPGAQQVTQTFAAGDLISLTGLKPSTQYTIYLSVANAVGFGQPLKFRVHTARDLTAKNIEETNNSSIKVQTIAPLKNPTNQEGRMDASDAYDLSYAEKNSYRIDSKNEYDSKYMNMKKPRKKQQSDVGNGQYTPLAIGVSLTLTIFIAGALACFCYAWKKKKLKGQPHSDDDFVSNRVQLTSPIPPNSILLVPVANVDCNGKPVLTSNDVENVTTELVNNMQHQQQQQQQQQANNSFNRANSVDSFSPYGTFPRRLNFMDHNGGTPVNSIPMGTPRPKLNLNRLDILSPSSPGLIHNNSNNPNVRMFEAFRPVSVDPDRGFGTTGNAHLCNNNQPFNQIFSAGNNDPNDGLKQSGGIFNFPNQTPFSAKKFSTLTAVKPGFEPNQNGVQEQQRGFIVHQGHTTTPRHRPTHSNASNKSDINSQCFSLGENEISPGVETTFKVNYDGYQSGDNVDDDIDNVAYPLKMSHNCLINSNNNTDNNKYNNNNNNSNKNNNNNSSNSNVNSQMTSEKRKLISYTVPLNKC